MYGINVIYTMKSGKREEFLAGVLSAIRLFHLGG